MREQHETPELHPSSVSPHERYAHLPPRHWREQHSEEPVQDSPVFLQAGRQVPEQLLLQHWKLDVHAPPLPVQPLNPIWQVPPVQLLEQH